MPNALTDAKVAAGGLVIEAVGVGQRLRAGRDILSDVSVRVPPGRVTAIAGSSGAGKTVLLEVLAGIRKPATGEVRHGGAPLAGPSRQLGFVPQEDIIHRELSLARTLSYAAKLRMSAATSEQEIGRAVAEVLAALGLSERADQRVGYLSGGERKRASIAVELLTRPRVLFLDEPTSGLDPATGAALMGTLQSLAADGTTVVLTTHTPADLLRSDRVLFLSPAGEVAYDGPPTRLTTEFAVQTVEDVYAAVGAGRRVPPVSSSPESPTGWSDGRSGQNGSASRPPATADTPDTPAAPTAPAASAASAAPAAPETAETADAAEAAGPVDEVGGWSGRVALASNRDVPGAWRQWWLLSRRSADILRHNRLTVAVLAGSPVMIVAMFAVLFRPGAFDPGSPSPGSAAMILFWIAFGSFFFGLTYGLLQVVTELPIIRRERLTVLRLGPYLGSKLAVLLPVLAAADALLLAVLRALDRLPEATWSVYGSLFLTALLSSLAALAVGLLASAAVSEPGQATLMLPLLCFPQVLFSGAFVPVPEMAWPGWALSFAMTNRWAFEGLGSGIGLAELWSTGRSPLGPPLLASYGDSFDRPDWFGWLVLAGFALLSLAAAWALLARRTKGPQRG